MRQRGSGKGDHPLCYRQLLDLPVHLVTVGIGRRLHSPDALYIYIYTYIYIYEAVKGAEKSSFEACLLPVVLRNSRMC